MRYFLVVPCLLLGGCVADQAMNYGTPVAAAPPVMAPLRPVQPRSLAPIPETPMATLPGSLPPVRPYQPAGLAPVADPPVQVMPGVLPPIRPVTLGQ